jgi:hypothetical protein
MGWDGMGWDGMGGERVGDGRSSVSSHIVSHPIMTSFNSPLHFDSLLDFPLQTSCVSHPRSEERYYTSKLFP